jgi:hypothetical protein
MFEVHERLLRSHQSRIKMRWLIMNHDFHLPSITNDCISYAKRCQEC